MFPDMTWSWKVATLHSVASCRGNLGELGRSSHWRFHFLQRAMPDMTVGTCWAAGSGGVMLSDHHRRGRDTRPQEAASHKNERRPKHLSNVSWAAAAMTTFSTSMVDCCFRSVRKRRTQSAHCTNFAPSGPEVPRAPAPFMLEKSWHGGAPQITTRVCSVQC